MENGVLWLQKRGEKLEVVWILLALLHECLLGNSQHGSLELWDRSIPHVEEWGGMPF